MTRPAQKAKEIGAVERLLVCLRWTNCEVHPADSDPPDVEIRRGDLKKILVEHVEYDSGAVGVSEIGHASRTIAASWDRLSNRITKELSADSATRRAGCRLTFSGELPSKSDTAPFVADFARFVASKTRQLRPSYETFLEFEEYPTMARWLSHVDLADRAAFGAPLVTSNIDDGWIGLSENALVGIIDRKAGKVVDLVKKGLLADELWLLVCSAWPLASSVGRVSCNQLELMGHAKKAMTDSPFSSVFLLPSESKAFEWTANHGWRLHNGGSVSPP